MAQRGQQLALGFRTHRWFTFVGTMLCHVTPSKRPIVLLGNDAANAALGPGRVSHALQPGGHLLAGFGHKPELFAQGARHIDLILEAAPGFLAGLFEAGNARLGPARRLLRRRWSNAQKVMVASSSTATSPSSTRPRVIPRSLHR